MLLAHVVLSLAFGAFAVSARYLPSTTSDAITVPTPSYLFMTHLNLAKPLDIIPILEASVVVVEPVINGTNTGHALNGTTHADLVGAVVVANNTIRNTSSFL